MYLFLLSSELYITCRGVYTLHFLAEPVLSSEYLSSQTANVFRSRISGSSNTKLELPGV